MTKAALEAKREYDRQYRKNNRERLNNTKENGEKIIVISKKIVISSIGRELP